MDPIEEGLEQKMLAKKEVELTPEKIAEVKAEIKTEAELEVLAKNKTQEVKAETKKIRVRGREKVSGAMDFIKDLVRLKPEQEKSVITKKQIEARLDANQKKVETLGQETENKIKAVAEGKEADLEKEAKKQEIINKAGRERVRTQGNQTLKYAARLTPGFAGVGLMHYGENGEVPHWMNEGLDYVPIVGGVKMTHESLQGHTYDGRKLEGGERLVHGMVGASSVFADLVPGAGLAERAAGKAALKGAEIAGEKVAAKEGARAAGKGAFSLKKGVFSGRSVSFLENGSAALAGRGDVKGAKFVEGGAGFLKKHPDFTKRAEEHADNWVKEQVEKLGKKREEQREAA